MRCLIYTGIIIISQCLLDAAIADTNFTSLPKFPDDFMFGVSTSAFQIEGAWDVGGKSENIWEKIIHDDPSLVSNNDTADETCNSYYLYERDIEMLVELKVDFYRFSLSWPRILPTGRAMSINQDGIRYYDNLIDKLLEKNITPFVSLYHWDLPQILQYDGGFLSDDFPKLFEEYAKVAFEAFGDRVKYWVTFNEPMEICVQGYGMKDRAPQLNLHGIGEYKCTANLLGGHARAYHLYNDTYKPIQNGKVGIAISSQWGEPQTDSPIDIQATDEALQFYTGIYVHPIYSKEGGYPPAVVARVPKDRLFLPPSFPELRNSSDFLGINHYDLYYVNRTSKRSKTFVPSFTDDLDVNELAIRRWSKLWVKLGPPGFGKLLHWFKDNYNDPEIIITENGLPSGPGLDDRHRMWWFRRYLAEILKAISEGVRVKGYAPWSLMDNFEWFKGFSERFGLYQIDFNDSNKTRIPRRSAMIYKEIIQSRTVDPDYLNDEKWSNGDPLENLSQFKFTPKFNTSATLIETRRRNRKTSKTEEELVIESLDSQLLTFNRPFD